MALSPDEIARSPLAMQQASDYVQLIVGRAFEAPDD